MREKGLYNFALNNTDLVALSDGVDIKTVLARLQVVLTLKLVLAQYAKGCHRVYCAEF
jgi:hypothetical protein